MIDLIFRLPGYQAMHAGLDRAEELSVAAVPMLERAYAVYGIGEPGPSSNDHICDEGHGTLIPLTEDETPGELPAGRTHATK